MRGSLQLRHLLVAVLAVVAAAGCASVRSGEPAGSGGRGVMPAPAGAGMMPPDENAGIAWYLGVAFSNNPGLKAAWNRREAALERVPQSRSLEDPELSYEHFVEQKDLRGQVSLTQEVPFFGKLGLIEKQALAEAEAAAHEFEAAKLMVYDEVNRAFYEYRYLGRAIGAMEENSRLMADLEAVVRAGYETGMMNYSDLVKAQVEKDRMANELAGMLDERRAMSDKLAAALDISTDKPLPWPKDEPPAPVLVDDSVLFGMIEDLNPDLKTARAMVTKAELGERLARKDYLPDLMLGASFMIMPGSAGGKDEYDTSLMAGLKLPLWWGRKTARARETKALAEAARGDLKNLQNGVRADLSMALFKLRDAERRVSLLKDSLVPRAEQAYEVSRKDYSAGKTGFMGLIDARRTVLEFKLMYERAAADRELAMAEIGCCIGMYGDSLRQAVEGGK